MSTQMKNIFYTVLLAGFANPKYIGDVAGFDLADFTAIAVSFENGATSTVTHQQTFDPTGAAGWFPVVGRSLSSAALSPAAAGSVDGQGYVYPKVGARGRFVVSALTVANLIARVGFVDNFLDLSPMSVALGAGAAAIGSLAAGTAVIGATPISASSTVGVGTINARIKSAATTNATLVLAGARKLFGYSLHNTSAAKKYVKFYNKATAPTVGTDVPVATVELPIGGSISYFNPIGKAFSLGLCYAITNLLADSDTTAVAVDDVTGHLDYV